MMLPSMGAIISLSLMPAPLGTYSSLSAPWNVANPAGVLLRFQAEDHPLPYRLRRKSIIAALTSNARSCCIQWPQFGRITLLRNRGTLLARLAIT